MSELRDPHLQVPHVHPNDYSGHLGDPRDRTSGISRHSQSSAHTWAYTSQQNPPPESPRPPRPLPIPGQREVVNLNDPDPDEEEYMNIEPNGLDVERNGIGGQRIGSPSSSKRKDGGSNFVGGFVSGLRRFPRVVMRSYGNDRRKRARRGTTDTSYTGGTSVSTLPKYEANPEPTPQNNNQYVEAMQMPVEEPAPIPQGYHPPPCHDLEDLYEATYEGVSTTRHSTVRHSGAPHSTPHPSSARQTMLQEDVAPAPLDMLAHETSHNSALDSPVLVDPQPTSDYAKMSPNIHIPTETSSISRVHSLRRFFQNLRDLPWVSSRVTADYIPGAHTNGHKKQLKSWYTRPPPLDDYLNGTSRRTSASRPNSASPRQRRRQTRSSTTSQISRYPYTGPATPPDSRARKPRHARRNTYDGARSRSSNGHRSSPLYAHGYTPYGYNYAPAQPQPLYVMHPPQSHPASPTTTNVVPGYAEMRQAVPVYVVTPPSTGHEKIHESPGSPTSQYPMSFSMPMTMPMPQVPAPTS